MESINFQLEAVRERFPEYKEDILSLYYKDPEFRAICEDYYLCIRYLEKVKKEYTEKIESINEYERIQTELEKELKSRLNPIGTKDI
jgi:uncharacterized protein (UPF0262 family)